VTDIMHRSQTFPQRSPLNCRWPTDFNADEKQQVRSFITAWLDDGHDDLWSRDKSQAEASSMRLLLHTHVNL
jgi:hypothetical protein